MEELRHLLVKNQNNLEKLRNRIRFCKLALNKSELDIHRQYGPFCEFWDEWIVQLDIIESDLRSDLSAAAQFCSDLREFVILTEARTKTSKAHTARVKEMVKMAKEALQCQKDMLHIADEQLLEHKEFTHKLLLVEAIDSLNED